MTDIDHETLHAVRIGVLGLFVAGVVGTAVELLLVGHFEDFRQRIPLLLITASLIALGWRAFTRGRSSLRLFRFLMLLFVASGFVGLLLHYRANVEFEREVSPALSGARFFLKAIRGAAPPSLAPAGMCGLGALGWLYTFRHPALGSTSRISATQATGDVR